MTGLRTTSLVLALITTALSAGLFFVWSYSVMPGLKRSSDRTFVEFLQHTNKAMLNGWFALTFGGAVVFMLLAGALLLGADSGIRSAVLPWVIAALVLYIVQMGITFGVNVPLNDDIDKAGAVDKIADLAAVREHFEAKWVRWNNVRSVVSVASFSSLTWALLQYGRHTGKS
ncbi:DUF1772 domain-containing protein [Streptomyces boninensis]|uniref:anthrone oxygenase family protein n=1 Tax=Streptomyces boninensis TaxID=2039455 RepID=UPI003B2121A4